MHALRLSLYMMASLTPVAAIHWTACRIAISSAVYIVLFEVIQNFSSMFVPPTWYAPAMLPSSFLEASMYMAVF